ncbi:MAG: PAS domain S-box protein [Methermicoccaceae archaeon]
MKVLVVDDEASVRTYIREVLEENGYEVTTASGEEDSIKKFEADTYDVVLLDLVLKKGDSGVKILRLMKRTAPLVPVIIITGYASVDSAVETLKEGAYDYLVKPFKVDILLSTIRRAQEYRQLSLELEEKRRALADAKRRYQTLFEETSDAVVVFDEVGHMIDANTLAEKLLGYTREELLSLNIFDIFAKTDFEQVFPSVVSDYSAYFEIELKRKDGTTLTGEMSARSLYLDESRYIQAVIRDITQRKETELDLRRERDTSEKLLRTISEYVIQMLASLKGKLVDEDEAVLRGARAVLEDFPEVWARHTSHQVLDVVEHTADLIQDMCPDVRVKVDEPSFKEITVNPLLEFVLLGLI